MELTLNIAAPTVVAYCDNVTRHFVTRNAMVVALDDVSLRVGEGELVAIAGPSGSGKSTMLSILGCLDRPTSGSVRVQEQDVSGPHEPPFVDRVALLEAHLSRRRGVPVDDVQGRQHSERRK